MSALLTTRRLRLQQAEMQIAVPDVTLHTSQRLFLCGPSGCGKTSFLHALLGFVPLAGGELQVMGSTRVRPEDFQSLRGQLGLLFQNPADQLLGPTVLEDICFGPLNRGVPMVVAARDADKWLERLKIMHLRDRQVARLSGGEQQRVALAGLLIMQPKILLLDEPCTGLDQVSREVVLACLEQCDIPMLVASHEPWLIERLATDTVIFSGEPA